VTKLYRENVCAVIRNGNSVLICHRNDSPIDLGWQFPQGGIDKGEDLISELKRELFEEIGTDRITVIATLPKYYQYDFPEEMRIAKWGGKYHGQRQRWVLCEFADDKPQIRFDCHDEPEFDAFEWINPKEALARIVDFKKEVYRKALSDLKLI